MGVKCSQRLAVELVGIGDFGNTANRKLGGQVEGLAHGLIRQAMDGELAKRRALPGQLADVITGSVGCLKCALERMGLFRRREQLDGSGQSHTRQYTALERLCQVNLAAWRFLCRLKSAVSALWRCC